MKTTYVLLAAINDYPYPIPRLNGCLKDLDLIENYISDFVSAREETRANLDGLPIRKIGSLHICRLENEQVTYHNLIRAFRHFLGQAGSEDVVWFHFSGHGSEELTAKEFLSLEPNGKDQTLVCYQAQPEDGRLHLADKELAALLHEVATQYLDGRPKTKPPHIVVSLDCCHSGSGTRDFMEDPELRTRAIKSNAAKRVERRIEDEQKRPLDSYLELYATQWREQKNLEVPLAPHVLLSACQSVQKAGDLPGGGIFTSSLVQALRQARGKLNYSDLFVRTRAFSRNLRRNQTPQFESLGNFDPFTRFLDGAAWGRPDHYEVAYKGGEWFVKCGAIQGLPVVSEVPVELEIQSPAPENKPVARAQILSVGAQRSPFQIVEGKPLQAGVFYQALISHMPAPPLFVWLHGDEVSVNRLENYPDKPQNINWLKDPRRKNEAPIEVEAIGEDYLLHIRRSGRLFFHQSLERISFPAQIVYNLGKIAKWNRTVQLKNPKSKIQKWIDFELGVKDLSQQIRAYRAEEIRLYVNKDNFFFHTESRSLYAWFYPKVVIRKASQELYCYLLHLRANYSIEAPEGEIVFRPEEHPGKQEVEIPLMKTPRGWGLSPGEPESTSYFQLLVTTEPLNYPQLLQSKLGAPRGGIRAWRASAIKNDWYSSIISVALIRAEAKLSAGVAFGGGKFQIKPHPELEARISFSAAPANEQSADPAAKFPLFQSPHFKLLDFRADKTFTRLEILELSDLAVVHTEILEKPPLEVILSCTLNAGETILPIAFDGRDFRIVGKAEAQEEQTIVRFRKLPQPLVPRPDENGRILNPLDLEERRHYSLFQTLKIAFFKFSPLEADQRQFAWVDYKSANEVDFCKQGLSEKLATAKKAVVILPNLIGEPTLMKKEVELFLTQNKTPLQVKFDLILVYHYSLPRQKDGIMLKDLGVGKETQISFLSSSSSLESSAF